MALSLGILIHDQVKGPYRGSPASAPLHLDRITIPILSGSTYSTGGVQVDICSALMLLQQTGVVAYGARMGYTSIAVTGVLAYGDYSDGTIAATINTASVALASGGAATPISAASTNNLVTVKLFTGVNGIGGAEITNATVLAGGAVTFLVAYTAAVAGLGNI